MKGATTSAVANFYQWLVSIRAPREGGDQRQIELSFARLFQSAPPVKGATRLAV